MMPDIEHAIATLTHFAALKHPENLAKSAQSV
jgi:hypothetical protein